MSVYNPDIQSLQVGKVNETTSGTAEAVFTGVDVRATSDIKLALAQQANPDPTVRQRIGQVNSFLLGLKSGKLDFSTFLRGTGTAAASGVAAKGASDYYPEALLLRNCFGGESKGTGTTISGSESTTTLLKCTSGAGLLEGQAVLVDGIASVIGAISTNDVTLLRALSSAPDGDTVVNASATYYFTQTATNTLQFQFKGAQDDYWDITGCKGTCKLSGLNAGDNTLVNYSFQGMDWNAYTSASIANDSYANSANPSPVGYASTVWIQDNGTTTANEVDIHNMAVDPGIAYEQIKSASGTQGVQAYARSKSEPIISFDTAFADDWRDDFEAQTAKYIHLQIGTTAGSTVLIEIPNFVISKSVELSKYNSMLGSKITGMGLEDVTLGTDDLDRSPIRVHLL